MKEESNLRESMTSRTDKIYQDSPVWLQQILVAIYGYWWFQRRFGEPFHRLVVEFKEREHWSLEQFLAYQEFQLDRIISSAWNSPYYKEVFSDSGVTKQTSSWEVLKSVPVLTKETLRTRPKDLLTQEPVPPGTIIQKSSGTTGTPTPIYYTKEFHAFELAVPEARNLNWAGVNYRDRRVMFGVRKVCNYQQDIPPFWRFSPVENMAYASIYHLSPKYLPFYLEFLRSYQPDLIMGYPSALSTIARYAIEHNDLPAPAKVVITMSETLEPRAREVIEKTWQCRVMDRYGAVEGCMFASQCEYGQYHVSPEVGIIEILDRKGNPCPPGVKGEVVCTGLKNDLQPLIRYKVGDVACWSKNQHCSCNRQMPILEGIEGRYEDICYTPDGREMLRFDTVFKGVENIKEAQVVQEQLNLFTIYIVPGKNFNSSDVELIQLNMKHHAGDVHTNVETVLEIPRSSSGKFRAVICKLPQDQRRPGAGK
jgi:phenylacetate-CoA ligase